MSKRLRREAFLSLLATLPDLKPSESYTWFPPCDYGGDQE
jgi:hypothetical protein